MKSIILITLVLFSCSSSFAEDAKWNCIKDSNEISVKGMNTKEKMKDCELLEGQWTQKKIEIKVIETVEPKTEVKSPQTSGGGGGW